MSAEQSTPEEEPVRIDVASESERSVWGVAQKLDVLRTTFERSSQEENDRTTYAEQVRQKLTAVRELIASATTQERRALQQQIDLLPTNSGIDPELLTIARGDIAEIQSETQDAVDAVLNDGQPKGSWFNQVKDFFVSPFQNSSEGFGKAGEWFTRLWHNVVARFKGKTYSLFGITLNVEAFLGFIDFDKSARLAERYSIEDVFERTVEELNKGKENNEPSRFVLAEDWDDSLPAEQQLRTMYANYPSGAADFVQFLRGRLIEASTKMQGGGEVTLSRIENVLREREQSVAPAAQQEEFSEDDEQEEDNENASASTPAV